MNPADLAASVRLTANQIFRLPAVALPELIEAISFEDTEAALARLLGGYLPAPGAWHAVAGRRGVTPEPFRPGDTLPARFGDPRPNRAGAPRHSPSSDANAESTADSPQWTHQHGPDLSDAGAGAKERAPTVPPGLRSTRRRASVEHATGDDGVSADERSDQFNTVTRLERGAAALSAVLRAGTAAPPNTTMAAAPLSTWDTLTQVAGHTGPESPRGTSPTATNLADPGAAAAERVEPAVLAGPVDASGDPRPDPDREPGADALIDAVLGRLRDQLELEFHRTYGLGEW